MGVMRFLVFFNRKYGIEIFFPNVINILKIVFIIMLISFVFMKKSYRIIGLNLIILVIIFLTSNDNYLQFNFIFIYSILLILLMELCLEKLDSN